MCKDSTLVAGGKRTTTVSCSSHLVAMCEDSALVGAGIPWAWETSLWGSLNWLLVILAIIVIFNTIVISITCDDFLFQIVSYHASDCHSSYDLLISQLPVYMLLNFSYSPQYVESYIQSEINIGKIITIKCKIPGHNWGVAILQRHFQNPIGSKYPGIRIRGLFIRTFAKIRAP